MIDTNLTFGNTVIEMESTDEDDGSSSNTNGNKQDDRRQRQPDQLVEQLRYRFQDHPLPFRALFAAGWNYKAPHYQAPNNGRMFETAEMNAYFDQFALPDVISNIQSFRQAAEQDDQEGRLLRQAVLDELHKLMTNHGNDESGDETDNSHDTDDKKKGRSNQEAPTETAASEHPAIRRSGRLKSIESSTLPQSRNNRYASVTTTEKGSDLYLHKKTKSAARPKSLTNKNNADFVAEDLVLPTLKECMEFAQQQIRDNQETFHQQEAKYRQNDFADWRFLLSTNHSLLFYGAGSKYELITTFAQEELSREGYVLMIDGFDDEVTSIETTVLDLLVQLFLDEHEPESQSAVLLDDGDYPVQGISNPYRSHPVVERAVAISRALAHKACETLIPIFLVIHSIEGAFPAAVDQEALASLVTNSKVSNGTASLRLVVTTDHLDVMSLWDVAVATNFSWIWKQVDTGRPYFREFRMLMAEDSKRKKTTKSNRRMEEQQEARVIEVLETMAPRHGEILQVLARLQWEQMSKHNNKWVDYSTFWNECRNCLVVSKESQLQLLLNELKDHRLVSTRRDDGSEYLTIPYSNAKIREVLSFSRKRD